MKCSFCYEILLASAKLDPQTWAEFIQAVSRILGPFAAWQISAELKHYTLHFYLHSPAPLPASLGQQAFLLKLAPTADFHPAALRGVLFNQQPADLAYLIRRLESKQSTFERLELNFTRVLQRSICSANLYYSAIQTNQSKHTQKTSQTPRLRYSIVLPPSAETLLAIDFTTSRDFVYQKVPKYLPTHKIIHFLAATSEHALLAVDTFPYSEQPHYLTLNAFDFAKHSLIIGSSGAGKSKFIALFLAQLAETNSAAYKVVVIDPHDSLKYDCTGIGDRKIVDFTSSDAAIDLFSQSTAELSVSVELTLGLFKQYFNDGYNGRLERVLRYSLFLLMQAGNFSFVSLRRLLLDADFRGQLIAETPDLPSSVKQFFLTDFSELKTGSYNTAIAPIIAFIDEMQMVPLFSAEFQAASLQTVLSEHFLTIFSLNRLRLGEQVTKIIAGLLCQQLFLLAEAMPFEQHLIIIVDEVSVVECPILARALSELRKFGVSIILAGQYFHQISSDLRESILANTTNYFIFRSSKTDANILAANLDIKIAGDDTLAGKIELITKLKTRECLVRISHDEKLQPVFRATTIDYVPSETNVAENVIVNPVSALLSPEQSTAAMSPVVQSTAQSSATPEFSFDLDDETSSEQLIQSNSTSRKKL